MSFAKVTGVALVTGAAAGIGRETGYAFAEAGALVVAFADINFEGAKMSAEKSNGFAKNSSYQSFAIQVDVADVDSVQSMVDRMVEKFGRIDYLVHSAGLGATSLKPTSDLDIANFDETLSVNTRGTMLITRAVTKAMSTQEPLTTKGRHGDERSLGRGSIVHIASAFSYIAAPGMMAYVASKHAMMGMVKVAAVDNAKHQIRINALCPSWVQTSMLERSLERWKGLEAIIQKASPAGRAATAEELANIAVFMCSPSASYVNGSGLIVDAGMTVTAHI
ncbi:putative short-chain dehydrogenase reductase family protein [Botrytis cinerea BcDW1]|uniref:Short-chain dehydrogenase/reductase ABA4 n=1 Tax=Botryotinia fuckeliana (strain BcDW1) TaxID=1290391 RepID=M7U5J4_BOTF1|nr:putative short-chain dehydrogenase reductase family protein [Botrytis cinerea BcDW1]